jgi:hypothetical protein
MSVMIDERPIFENEDWLVTENGLEHKRTGYFIERDSLGQRREDGLWAWPLHMAEKSWCAMKSFTEAFSRAASLYGVATGAELTQTLQVARSEISPWPHVAEPAYRTVPVVPGALHPTRTTPISIEPRTASKPLNGQGFQGSDDVWRMRTAPGARQISTNLRNRSDRMSFLRETALPWRAPQRIRETGTALARLLQAAWTTR